MLRYRVDGRRLALAHPKLGPEVAALLRIPPLEETVHEVLDSFGAAPDLESIQVTRSFIFALCKQACRHACCDANCSVEARNLDHAFDVRCALHGAELYDNRVMAMECYFGDDEETSGTQHLATSQCTIASSVVVSKQ